MEERLAVVAAAAAGIVDVVAGGEVDLRELDRPADELRRFGLAGNPRYLLVETPYVGWPRDIPERLYRLRTLGITPVVAHPERNREVQERPALLEPLVAGGALVQLTAASVDGRLGRRTRAAVDALLDAGLAHLVASDAHEATVRAVGLRAAADSLDVELGRWLTVDVPRAIVDDAPLPPRPEGTIRPRRRLFGG
jgi:protein-tyrosine phosphatase